MPSAKFIVNATGLDAQFRLIPDDEEREEGEIEDDDDDDEEDQSDEEEKEEKNDERNDDKQSETPGEDNSGEKKANGDGKKSTKTPRISLFEMQSFLIALVLPEPRLSTPPNWCRVIRCMKASNVGIFLLDNDDLDWIENKAAQFSYAFRFQTSPNWIEQLTNVPLSRRLQVLESPGEFGRGAFERNLNAEHKVSKTALLLSPIQMIAESYPMPYDDGIRILRSKYKPVTDESPIFGIDCEMCITDRSELTRISIVDEDMRVVYNELVKPEREITDYLTRYSGITPQMMENVVTTLEDVQEFIRENLPRDSIFCGHSLNMDLSAIQIFHPYVIDTSVIYNRTGIRSQKPSLKALAYLFLGKYIQNSHMIGHDSLEDAITALELVKLKLVNGSLFGDAVALEKSQGIKYDQKTGITHLHLDNFIERHNVTPLSYRTIDTTPGARCLYVHDTQDSLDSSVKEAILGLLKKDKAICVVLTGSGECYVKF